MLRRESMGLSGPENRRHQHQEQKLWSRAHIYTFPETAQISMLGWAR